MTNAKQYFEQLSLAYVSQMNISRRQIAGDSDFVLIDVRNPSQDVADIQEIIPGAIHIPEKVLLSEVVKLGLSKDKQIIVYCWDNMCSLGYTAATKLFNAEYTNV